MNTYNNKRISENDIIEIESWLMYAHKNFNEETLTQKQLDILLKMRNSIKTNSKPKIKKN
jgi:hypothetical protein